MSHARPSLLRLSPPRLQFWLLSHYYLPRRDRWLSLYDEAKIPSAPRVRMRLIPGDMLSDRLAFTGSYEPKLTRRVLTLGRQGGMMVDVGANLGYFSLLWAACQPSNRVLAFEAAPRNVEVLRANIACSELQERINVIPCAAAAEAGVVSFDPGPQEQRGWGGISLTQTARSYEVKAVRIDEMIPDETPVSILKIDTEGADTLVLRGCERLLRRGAIREIWYEDNQPRREELGIPAGEAQCYLESFGYQVRATDKHHGEYVAVRATR